MKLAKNFLAQLRAAWPNEDNTDFMVGVDSFEDVEIDSTAIENFWYFKNRKKGLIKRFVLKRSQQVEKACAVTLIKKVDGKFIPRFDFQIWNITKKAVAELSKTAPDHNLVKAKVSLADCYENFLKLLQFLKEIQEIDFGSTAYAVIDRTKKDIFENLDKMSALHAIQKKYGSNLSEEDVDVLLNRKARLEHFRKLLHEQDFFASEKKRLTKTRDEDIWQEFFESNSWIFGYGLQLVSCEGLDERKLEQTVVGTDLVDGSGKRIDALLKTKGNISKILFCEIKNHHPGLLIEKYDRPGVFVPAKELRGAVAQIQKTIHKVTMKVQQSLRPTDKDGNPTGEEILLVKPRGVVIIGVLNDFRKEGGINYEELSSFELYRQQVNGIEIITYDELYERAKFIVQNDQK